MPRTLCFSTPPCLYYFYCISENPREIKFLNCTYPFEIKWTHRKTYNFTDFAFTHEVFTFFNFTSIKRFYLNFNNIFKKMNSCFQALSTNIHISLLYLEWQESDSLIFYATLSFSILFFSKAFIISSTFGSSFSSLFTVLRWIPSFCFSFNKNIF